MRTDPPPRFERFFTEGLALEVMPIPRHGPTHVHTHGFSELVIVLGGQGVHISPAGDYRIGAGDVFVLHGNQAHGYRDPAGLELVNLLFDLEALDLPLQHLLTLPGYHVLFTLEPRFRSRDRFESRLRLDCEQLPPVAELLARLQQETTDRRPGWRFAALAQFMLLMTRLCRAYARAQNPAAQPLLRLGRVLGYLEQHYGDPLALDELAELGGMSRRTLTREFRRAMDCSPLEYLTRLRLRHAVRLLQEGAESVQQIALRVGFADSSYFARQFRAQMGCSPREYRRQPPRPARRPGEPQPIWPPP